MPKYLYSCKECKEVFERIHSMNDKLVDCDLCNTAGTLKKIPANIAVQYRDNSVGKIVDEFIKETKEEVALEKEKLSSEEYNK